MNESGCYESLDGDWHRARNDDQATASSSNCWSVVTLNVLFSHWRGKEYHHAWVLPEQRYAYILDELLKMDADIVTLNEVTGAFVWQLRTHALAKRYFVGGLDTLGDGGNICLVAKRKGVPRFWSIMLPRLPRPAIACRLPGLLICTTHLSALTSNHERRAEQLRALTTVLEGERDATMLICGDLNFHQEPLENGNIPAGWSDTPYEGYSWDSSRNPMHAVLWPLGFESRQMRLDRALVRNGATRDCRLVFDKPVHEEHARNWTEPSLAQRTLWQCGFSQPDPRTYLMPSDHFGLSFQVSKL